MLPRGPRGRRSTPRGYRRPVLTITGSTGRLGSRVVAALADRPLRLLVRDAARAPRLPGAEVVVASYGDGEAARLALAGTTTLLMVSAAESADRRAEHLADVAAAVDAGVEHVVYTSFTGASPDAVFTLARDHAATEDALRASGMRTTVLRDGLYADLLVQFADEAGVLRGPAGDGRVAAVAVADVADALDAVLRDPAAHEGRTYELSGPQALTLDEVAATCRRVSGLPYAYERETVEQAWASRAAYGAPDWQVEAWVSTYLAIAAGEMATVSDDVERLTGRPATTLEQVLRGG